MDTARLPWARLAPGSYKALASVNESVAHSTLGKRLVDLVQTRVSQLNGCAYCVDMHVHDLRTGGEDWQRIVSLTTWRETALYDERERAALEWCESLTRLTDGHADHDAQFAKLKTVFSDQEIAELTVVVAIINAWNRLGVGMRLPPAAKPFA